MNSKDEALEPIVLVFSDGRRETLSAELTRRIWEKVERGHYSGPEELIHHALDALFRDDIQARRLEAHPDEGFQ